MKLRLFALALACTPCLAQTLVIRGAHVFDGERSLGVRDVLVTSGKISKIARGIQAPPRAQIIEASGKTLLPGLFDSHVHTSGPNGVRDSAISLRKSALFGVTTVISLFDTATPREMHELAGREPPGELADFLTAGILVTVKGGHVSRHPIPTLDDASQAQAFIDARIAEGSDLIKIVYEDFGGLVPRLSKASMKAAIDAAHVRGRLAVVHAGQGPGAARDAIEAGADGVAHSFVNGMPEDGYGRMFAARGAFLIPTFPLMMSVCALPDNEGLGSDPRIAPWLTASDARGLRSAIGKTNQHGDCTGAFASIPLLRDAGATILAGTDADNEGTAYGASIHEELEILRRCGLSPEQALTAATAAPARAWSLRDRGRIAPGLRADLILVNGDPTRDISRTRDIAGIWLAGVPVDRRKLLEEIKSLERRQVQR